MLTPESLDILPVRGHFTQYKERACASCAKQSLRLWPKKRWPRPHGHTTMRARVAPRAHSPQQFQSTRLLNTLPLLRYVAVLFRPNGTCSLSLSFHCVTQRAPETYYTCLLRGPTRLRTHALCPQRATAAHRRTVPWPRWIATQQPLCPQVTASCSVPFNSALCSRVRAGCARSGVALYFRQTRRSGAV